MTSRVVPLTDEVGELPTNIIAKIDATGPCWVWLGKPSNHGYGVAYYKDRQQAAYRGVWQFLVGPIPKGLELDHLCRNRMCVNPDHLELVTRRVNMLRGVHPSALAVKSGRCKRGHSDWEPNGKCGSRRCRTCRQLKLKELL